MTKIMLVEDDKSLREIYGIRLIAEGYDIKSAGDGEEALAMAIKERPDLIISDVMMPKISGFDMLDILRATPETKDIKIIMMTALSSEDQRARGEALGANRYLVKSQVGIEDVVRTVHDVLGDAPLSNTTAAQMFGSPAPSAVAAPQMTITQPQQPQMQQAQVQQPQSQMQSQPQIQPTSMPRPTAPFSSPAPASLASQMMNNFANTQQQPVRPAATSIPVQSEPTPAPVQMQAMPAPTPVTMAPQPTPTPIPINPVQSYAPNPTPFQETVQPMPQTAPAMDLSAMINQELSSAPQQPQNPIQ